jgi:hypothetical protein
VAEPIWSKQHKNACLPEAASMCEGLRGAGIKANVLLIYTPGWGHAVTTYLYPTGANRLWVWDATWRSLEVRAYANNPEQIARAWVTLIKPGTSITSAKFIE